MRHVSSPLELTYLLQAVSSPGRKGAVGLVTKKRADKPASSRQVGPATGSSKDESFVANMMSKSCFLFAHSTISTMNCNRSEGPETEKTGRRREGAGEGEGAGAGAGSRAGARAGEGEREGEGEGDGEGEGEEEEQWAEDGEGQGGGRGRQGTRGR